MRPRDFPYMLNAGDLVYCESEQAYYLVLTYVEKVPENAIGRSYISTDKPHYLVWWLNGYYAKKKEFCWVAPHSYVMQHSKRVSEPDR